MKNLLWSSILVLLFTSSSFASESTTIDFYGQESDLLTLDTINTVTRYRDRVVDSTCTRQIPYQTQECGNETRYREECSWQPGRNVCRTEYQQVCRNVRRTRRECTNQPGQRRCRMTQPRQICRNGQCRTEPARRICEDGPSRQVCRNVNYNDRVCNREPRQVCNLEPGRNVCRNVSYQEYVCRNVTRYRSETYACRRTIQDPYEVNRKVSADVNIEYKGATRKADTSLIFNLLETGSLSIDIADNSPVDKLISVEKNLSINEEPDQTKTTGLITFKFFNKDKVLAPIKSGISSAGLSSSSAYFSIGKVSHPKKLNIHLKIVRDGLFSSPKTLLNKTLSSDHFSISENGNKSKVTVDLSQFGVSLDDKKYEVTVKVMLDYGSEFLNLDSNQSLSTQAFFELRP